MHEANILNVQNETLKIIEITQELLKDFSKISNKDDNATLSSKNIENYLDTLSNGEKKVKNLEFVITVVGTMKAGKSTTINAIVGQEVLPNRSFPMTSLPTLVTHKQEQSEPQLTLPKREPLEKLLENIKKVIKKDTDGEFLGSSDGKEIKISIEEDTIIFKDKYHGQKEIFTFLKTLNDLMRVAKELDIEAPYEEFIEVNELPRIEVEFYHLKHIKNISESKLSILDTPGPNEFKHSEQLQEVFKKQMHLASAIILVMDYTVMNSKGDNEVREQVKEITNLIGKERMFVLLNKFDEKGRNDSNYNEAKEHVAKYLLNNQVPLKNIYPVSSKLAFWVNRGLSEIKKNSSLNNDLDWIEDFGQEIIGKRWKKIIDDTNEVIEICNEVWKEDSYFEEPLNNIIVHAHSKSAIASISVALGKLLELSKQIDNALKTKKNALTENIEKLKSNIDDLEKDINKMTKISNQIDKDIANRLKSNDNIIKDLMNIKTKESKQEALEIFKIAGNNKKESLKNKNDKNSLMSLLLGVIKHKPKKFDDSFNELNKKGEIEFSTKKDAVNFMLEINDIISKYGSLFIKNSRQTFKNEVKKIIPMINNTIKDYMGDLLDVIQNKVGIDLGIKVPVIEFNKKGLSLKNNLSNSIKEEKKTYTRSVVRNKFTNFFNDNWGRESIEYEKIEYKILRKDIDKLVTNQFKYMSEQVFNELEEIYSTIRTIIFTSLENITREVEGYRCEMLAVVKDRESKKFNIENEILTVKSKEELIENNIKRIITTEAIIEKLDIDNE